ncbi:hypothetical protein JRQ81_017669, partial [Phrynocephalus forsythii]
MGERSVYQRLASGEEEEAGGLVGGAPSSGFMDSVPTAARPDVLPVPAQRIERHKPGSPDSFRVNDRRWRWGVVGGQQGDGESGLGLLIPTEADHGAGHRVH